MIKFIIRTAIAFALTYGMWHWYNSNVLSKLDIEAQLIEQYENYTPDDYNLEEDEEDKDFSYDDYDTGGDW